MNASANYSEDERIRILRMVEEGKISASEGISLLDALGRPARPAPAQPTPDEPVSDEPVLDQPEPVQHNRRPAGVPINGGPRWLRVQVTDVESGRSKATVNIPLALMDWGLRIGAQFAPEVGQYDLRELARIMREEGMGGKIIDVVDDEDREHVEIFVD